MNPMYRVWWPVDARPTLHQLEHQGRADTLYALRFVDVWAVNLATARWIQRDYRRNAR